jgi:hypothetical protein
VFFLLRGLPVLIEVGLLIYCLIDAIQTPGNQVRNLPKLLWILLIVLVPLVGGIAWLFAGRPTEAGDTWRIGDGFPEHDRPRPARSIAPDDDAEFLARLRRPNDEPQNPPT